MKRVFLCLSHQTHLLKEHLIKLKLNYVTYYVLLRSPFSVLRSTTFYYVLRSTFYVLLRSTFYVLRSTFYVLLSTIYVTFWFDGKFYSRTCSGVDLLSGVHTTGCQPLHLLSRTVNEVNDWVKVPLAERLSNNGGQTIERSRRAMYFRGLRGGSTGSLLCNAITEGNALSGYQRG